MVEFNVPLPPPQYPRVPLNAYVPPPISYTPLPISHAPPLISYIHLSYDDFDIGTTLAPGGVDLHTPCDGLAGCLPHSALPC